MLSPYYSLGVVLRIIINIFEKLLLLRGCKKRKTQSGKGKGSYASAVSGNFSCAFTVTMFKHATSKPATNHETDAVSIL